MCRYFSSLVCREGERGHHRRLCHLLSLRRGDGSKGGGGNTRGSGADRRRPGHAPRTGSSNGSASGGGRTARTRTSGTGASSERRAARPQPAGRRGRTAPRSVEAVPRRRLPRRDRDCARPHACASGGDDRIHLLTLLAVDTSGGRDGSGGGGDSGCGGDSAVSWIAACWAGKCRRRPRRPPAIESPIDRAGSRRQSDTRMHDHRHRHRRCCGCPGGEGRWKATQARTTTRSSARWASKNLRGRGYRRPELGAAH
mmetsp:Transcript_10311/g.25312  ORF Transcript_10311/g.25312 Transcript_10311/m.25312 type:complete len:255 (+) Transcript_10311:1987-2751(+)